MTWFTTLSNGGKLYILATLIYFAMALVHFYFMYRTVHALDEIRDLMYLEEEP